MAFEREIRADGIGLLRTSFLPFLHGQRVPPSVRFDASRTGDGVAVECAGVCGA